MKRLETITIFLLFALPLTSFCQMSWNVKAGVTINDFNFSGDNDDLTDQFRESYTTHSGFHVGLGGQLVISDRLSFHYFRPEPRQKELVGEDCIAFLTCYLDTLTPAGTKLEHARNQTLKNASSFIEAYNDKLEDLNIDYCSTNEKGNIIRDARGQYIFTKDNQRALSKELKKFMDSELIVPFEIVPTTDKKGLSDPQVEYLTNVGFIRGLMTVI